MAEAAVSFAIDLVTVECGSCAMIFAMPRTFHRQCRESGRLFRCPNPKCEWGEQHYTKTENQKLKAELEAEKRRAESAVKARRWAEEQRDRAEARRRAAKGQVTKLKKRAAAGVCPCCKRSFENLRRHMETKHPNLVAEDAASAE